MSAVNPIQILPKTFLAGTATTLFTVPAAPSAKYYVVTEIRLNNIDSVNHTFKLGFYPAGGSASDVNLDHDAVSIQPAGAMPIVESCFIVLNPGDVFYGLTDTANKVSISISGEAWT